MQISRRDALASGAAAVVTGAITAPLAIKAAGVKEALAGPDPLLAGVQALVDEIRQDLGGSITTNAFWALQQAADRLEALPGIQPVPNEHWEFWRQDVGEGRYGLRSALRGLPS